MCFREFGDRVKYWTTVNEANVFALGGYDSGNMPPGRCSPPFGVVDNCSAGSSSTEPYLVTHHILLAHATAARLYEKMYKVIAKIFDIKCFDMHSSSFDHKALCYIEFPVQISE